MKITIQKAASLAGTVTVPPDKAICHRAVLLASLARGRTEIRPWPLADDCQRTLEVVQQLGVRVTRTSDAVQIEGRGVQELSPPAKALACGESGTTLRLMAGLLAGQPFASRLTASPSLSRRPMRRIVAPLSQMGAEFAGKSSAGSDQELYPPLSVQGRSPLRAMRYEMPLASAQVKSAILLAGLFADGPTTVVERQPTRDHTERMLVHYGAALQRRGQEIVLTPGPLTAPGALPLPGDFSSAAFLLTAAACVPGSEVTLQDVGLNPTRIALLHVLSRMGADVTWTADKGAWEPRGAITVKARPLRGTDVRAEEVPGMIDELPVLMAAAACASGRTRLTGVSELRVKETDRLRSMIDGLARLGVRIQARGSDGVDIEGGRLQGAEVDGAGDHRTVMSLAVAGVAADGRTTIRGAECVAKSFPDFFDHLSLLGVSRR